jgi:hypothetical protein
MAQLVTEIVDATVVGADAQTNGADQFGAASRVLTSAH